MLLPLVILASFSYVGSEESRVFLPHTTLVIMPTAHN